jgi:uroporphyrinogen decarboxylase
MQKIMEVFQGKEFTTPPCWFMRQAGRYLPEYRELRAKSGGFLPMCYTPDIATEITLQPIRRFGMDAAIIFSDILLIPQGLGRTLNFQAGEGPHLDAITHHEELSQLSLNAMQEKLTPVYTAIAQTRTALPANTALIGFAGAAWTLLCYMLDSNGKEDFISTRTAIYSNPALCSALIDILVEAITLHLRMQIDAGAQIVQIFDSWAAHVPTHHRETLLYAPTKRIVNAVRATHPTTPIICFPRGIGETDMIAFATYVAPDALSIDQFTDMVHLAKHTPQTILLQGNIDNLALAHDEHATIMQVTRLKQQMKGRRFIANLGHGVLPNTPISTMHAMIDEIRKEAPL